MSAEGRIVPEIEVGSVGAEVAPVGVPSAVNVRSAVGRDIHAQGTSHHNLYWVSPEPPLQCRPLL